MDLAYGLFMAEREGYFNDKHNRNFSDDEARIFARVINELISLGKDIRNEEVQYRYLGCSLERDFTSEDIQAVRNMM